MFKNRKTVLQLATRTTHQFGRPTDDLRSLVQIIELETLPSPTATKEFSKREVGTLLGFPPTTHSK